MKRYHTNVGKNGVTITPHTKGCLTALRELAPAGKGYTWTGPDDENKDVLTNLSTLEANSITTQLDALGFGQ